jgi:hypothetical protein
MAKKQKYVFNSKEVRRCIHHAVCSTKWTRWADPKFNNSEEDNLSDAALVIIEDYTGVYLMSAGQPRDRLRNKKIYSAYARGEDNNPKEYLDGARTTHLSDMESGPNDRIGCVAVIYLSVGENGHVYEELLAEMYDEFVVEITPATSETIAVIAARPSNGAARKIAAIEMNRDTDLQDAKTGRRIMLPEEQAATN